VIVFVNFISVELTQAYCI